MQKNSLALKSIRVLTLASMLTAMSVFIGIFCKNFLDFGMGLFRITFENLPIILAGILFGPMVGGLVGGTTDFISYLMAAQKYPLNFVVMAGAISVGVVSGIVSHYIIKRHSSLQIWVSGLAAHVIGSMIIKPIGLYQFYGAMVIWRIPIYLLIAPLEILIICWMFGRGSFKRLFGSVEQRNSKMTYKEAIDYIHSINWTFCKPGLERIGELCRKLGHPEKSLNFIHVAGTNGKGSFCSMTSSVLSAAGYRVGLFTSPYIKEFNERIQVNGRNISDRELIELTEYIKPIADKMEDKPTEFELITAMAFEFFKRQECDVVVLEAGLGGRLDSTNVITTPILSVITGIALEHTAILGDTVEKIAAEKAGIIKNGVPVLFGGEDKAAQKVIKRTARDKGSRFFVTDYTKLKHVKATLDGSSFDFGKRKELNIKLLGLYQPRNAASVLTAIDILKNQGLNIPETALRKGLKEAVWHARFERVEKDPTVIFDGAHNPQGIEQAVKSIKHYWGGQKVCLLTGVLKDKNYEEIAKMLATVSDRAFTLTPDSPRALSADEYAEVLSAAGINATACDSIEEAYRRAKQEAANLGLPLVCLGSLYVYSSLCPLFGGEDEV